MDSRIMEKKWTDIAESQLVGRKITAVRYMTEDERQDYGWSHRALIVQLNDGNFFFPSADDEGNDAGALFTADEKNQVLPVMR